MGHENVVCFVKTLDLPSFLTIENAFYSGLELLSWPIIQLCPLTLDRNMHSQPKSCAADMCIADQVRASMVKLRFSNNLIS